MSGENDLAKLVGRVAIALIFVLSGLGKLTDIAGTTAYFESLGTPSPNILAIVAGVVELFGGIAIMTGVQARLAALGLVVFTIVATLLAHRFWQIEDPMGQKIQMIMFLKNVSIVGALLYVFAAGAGRLAIGGNRG